MVFDVDGVLIHGYHARPELRRCWDEHLERDFGLSRSQFKTGFIDGTFVRDVLTGATGLVEALTNWFQKIGSPVNAHAFIDYWLTRDAVINDTLFAFLEDLTSVDHELELYIATNQEHIRAHHLFHTLRFNRLFRDIFYAAKLGVLKPDPLFFTRVARLLKLKSDDRPLLIDDTPAVVAAARAHGWQAIEFIDTEQLKTNLLIRPYFDQNKPRFIT